MRTASNIVGRRRMTSTRQTAIPQDYICATCRAQHFVGEVMTEVLGSPDTVHDGVVWVNCECGSTKVLFTRRARR